MTSLLVRPASIKDVQSIVKVRLGALTDEELFGFSVPGDNPYSSIKKLQKMWIKENKLVGGFEVFVAERDGKVIGFVVINMDDPHDNIDNIVVAKEEQRNDVGKTLVEYVERIAKSRGFDTITTDTTENARGVAWKAYGFWKRIGYEETGERISTDYSFKVIPLVKRLK